MKASMRIPAGDVEGPKHDQVYETLRSALISGQIAPGKGVTLRGLAAQLDVSPMPVREAIRRIAAEGGLEVRANRRVYVPEMTRQRFEELVIARSLLEPEAAAQALPFLTPAHVARLHLIEDEFDVALARNDVELYMSANRRFHFGIYTARPSDVLVPVISGLWMRYGPFMRSVYRHVTATPPVDNHQLAIAAIERGDAEALREAIRADIMDGMRIIGLSVVT